MNEGEREKANNDTSTTLRNICTNREAHKGDFINNNLLLSPLLTGFLSFFSKESVWKIEAKKLFPRIFSMTRTLISWFFRVLSWSCCHFLEPLLILQKQRSSASWWWSLSTRVRPIKRCFSLLLQGMKNVSRSRTFYSTSQMMLFLCFFQFSFPVSGSLQDSQTEDMKSHKDVFFVWSAAKTGLSYSHDFSPLMMFLLLRCVDFYCKRDDDSSLIPSFVF